MEFEPDNIRARSDYLKILNRKGKFEKALEQARYLSEREPGNVVYQMALAILDGSRAIGDQPDIQNRNSQGQPR